MCVWVTTPARMGLKIKVTCQSQGQGSGLSILADVFIVVSISCALARRDVWRGPAEASGALAKSSACWRGNAVYLTSIVDRIQFFSCILSNHSLCESSMLAFGVGRRACLGQTLALQHLFVFMTFIIQRFHLAPPSSSSSAAAAFPSFGFSIQEAETPSCAHFHFLLHYVMTINQHYRAIFSRVGYKTLTQIIQSIR